MAKKQSNKSSYVMIAILALLTVAAVVVAIAGCSKDNGDVPAISEETDPIVTEAQTTPETAPPETEPPETLPPETEPPPPPKFYSPLTGLECSEEISKQRPIGIMINNIQQALPQEGIVYGDVIYECLAEGGITRLFMLIQDYANVTKLGSVRSTRDYYLDFAQNHDALFFHAGGSEKAYGEIAARNIDNFDGVRMNIPNSFYRDPWRLNNMAYEHTLVITGEGVRNAIAYRGKRTELKEGFESPFNFAEEPISLEGEAASCVYLPFSYYQSPYLKYDETTNTYKRWQYNAKHADINGTQLEFDNIIVLFCYHTGPLDNYGRIEVTTTGEGEGYYINGGKYINIKYTKTDVDSPVKLFNADGTPLEMNTGKTYIAIFNSGNKAGINLNYNA